MLYGLDVIQIKKNQISNLRTLGYFTEDKLITLENIVKNNVTDIWETSYTYAVIYKVPENTLYYTWYRSIYKVFKVVIPEDKQYDAVKYEELNVEAIPNRIKDCYVDINVEEVFPQN